MRRTAVWLGIALLAGSWVLGVGYFLTAQWGWATVTIVGLVLLYKFPVSVPIDPRLRYIGAGMLLPAVLFVPEPYLWPPVIVALGLMLWSSRSLRFVASALIAGGVVLLAQSLTFTIYGLATARSHELPDPLPQIIAAVARWIGIDSGSDNFNVSMGTMRQTYPLGATWELLLDPATLCFLVGGLLILGLAARATLPTRWLRWRYWTRESGVLLLCVIGWLPLRVALLMSVHVHRALRTGYDDTISIMNQYWSPWVRVLLVIPPALLAARFVRLPFATPQAAGEEDERSAPPRHSRAAVACAFVAAAMLTLAFAWDPVGPRKSGRVLVDEYHSNWERTDKAFDTEWYDHLAAYNYAVLYDYTSRFFEMGRITTQIDDEALRSCDVLVCKIPTERYQPSECAAIRRFVERGGGLLMVGEHTDVWGSGTDLNDISRQFGFEYRMDCLFGLDSTFDEHFPPPAVRHPAISHMGPMDFAVSCSIDPGASVGTPVIWNTGLRNAPADYHASNFYPQVLDFAQARYGSFVQLWATQFGRGRVLAFTDSTIWSNFCFFDPGKSELWLGMTEWLNHGTPMITPWPWLTTLGVLAGGAVLWLSRRWDGRWVMILAAATLGWGVSIGVARAANGFSMPLPQARRSFTNVIIDTGINGAKEQADKERENAGRTKSESDKEMEKNNVILPKDGFIAGQTNGFGIFERWFLRLGYFFHRHNEPADVFSGDLAVVIYPDRPPASGYLDAMVKYVEGGGKVLILDSPENKSSTADTILKPFGLGFGSNTDEGGELSIGAGWPKIKVTTAREITGGSPIITLSGKPVAAVASKGKGTVTVIGFGSRFNDLNMGFTGDTEPDLDLRAVYGLDFELVSSIIEGRAMKVPTRPRPATSPSAPPAPYPNVVPHQMRQ